MLTTDTFVGIASLCLTSIALGLAIGIALCRNKK